MVQPKYYNKNNSVYAMHRYWQELIHTKAGSQFQNKTKQTWRMCVEYKPYRALNALQATANTDTYTGYVQLMYDSEKQEIYRPSNWAIENSGNTIQAKQKLLPPPSPEKKTT